ncbi:flagellar export protein FliJ [Oceanisphaera avium]|uniref:Flagellar FliJ protein n=1 Tax=Oceanisphaera avium TaxID=1903694 RepID=A0A1Y0CWT4_9GAMM|nr:flagellar export protein FliJ [Oceanisphaera avium]ART79729.1 flagellar export protein FliJ [Oceanisphaera avium]
MSRALHLLLEQLDNKERQASAELTAAQIQLQQMQQQQKMLSQYQRNYSEDFHARGQQGLSANQFNHFQGFINKLEVAQTQQMEGLHTAKQQLEQSRSAWLAVRARKQAIETLLEREAERKQKEQDKQEQKMLDELTLHRFYSQKKDNR